MESSGENAKEGGGGATSVRNVLLGGGPGSITFWCGDLGIVVGNVPEAGGSAYGIPQADNGTEGKAAEGRDLENQGIAKVLKESGTQSLGEYIDK